MVLCQVCNQPIDSERVEFVSSQFCTRHYLRKCLEPVCLHNSEQAKIFLSAKNSDWALVNSTNGILIDHGKNNEHRRLSSTTAKNNFLYISHRIDIDFALAVGVKAIHVDKDEPTIPQAVKGASAAETVAMRESVYGPFEAHAKAEQDMKRAMTSQPGWEKLNDVQKSAAEMIVHKLARVLNGSPDYDDNWHDISGYASLAENDIKNRTRTKPDSSESV